MGVNIHLISSDWKLNHLDFSFPPLEGSHTGENLCEIFTDSFNLNLIILHKMFSMETNAAFTDNNSTFCCASRSNQMRWSRTDRTPILLCAIEMDIEALIVTNRLALCTAHPDLNNRGGLESRR